MRIRVPLPAHHNSLIAFADSVLWRAYTLKYFLPELVLFNPAPAPAAALAAAAALCDFPSDFTRRTANVIVAICVIQIIEEGG